MNLQIHYHFQMSAQSSDIKLTKKTQKNQLYASVTGNEIQKT